MVLHFLSRIFRRDLGPRDSPTADSPPPTYEGGSGNGARANVATKMELEHMLANLEKAGVEIDGKIASIIDDEVARIKAEAARENINESKVDWKTLLDGFACIVLGFAVGMECCERHVRAAVVQKILG